MRLGFGYLRVFIGSCLASLPTSATAEIASVDPEVAEGRALAKEKKYTEAGDKFKSACDKKVGEGCYYLAQAVRNYRYPPATLEAQYELKERSCALKFGQGCYSIALDYRMGSQGLEIDKAKGNAFLERSCELGWGSGCGARASDYQYGFNETPKDPSKVPGYLKKACDAKQPSAEGCKDLAVAYAEGNGVAEDLDLAIATITKAYQMNPEDREINYIGNLLVSKKQEQAGQ